MLHNSLTKIYTYKYNIYLKETGPSYFIMNYKIKALNPEIYIQRIKLIIIAIYIILLNLNCIIYNIV